MARHAELAWVAGYVVRQFTCPKAVTHPSTNRAQCRATALIETNALPLHALNRHLSVSHKTNKLVSRSRWNVKARQQIWVAYGVTNYRYGYCYFNLDFLLFDHGRSAVYTQSVVRTELSWVPVSEKKIKVEYPALFVHRKCSNVSRGCSRLGCQWSTAETRLQAEMTVCADGDASEDVLLQLLKLKCIPVLFCQFCQLPTGKICNH